MKKLAVINGLRGYAILGVIYFHVVGAFFNPVGWSTYKIFDITIFPLTYLSNGWLGVDLFFILSGFVLYLPYATKSRGLTTKSDWWGFYKNRAARLFPLYYTVAIISVIFLGQLVDIYDRDSLRKLLLMFTFTFNFTKETFIPQSNYVLWSLGIEVLFSLIFPILIWGISKRGIVKFSLIVFYLSFIVRSVSCWYPEYNVAAHLNMIKDSIFGRLDDFIVGMLICHWFVTGWKQAWFEKYSIQLFLISMVVITLGCYISDYVFLHMIPAYCEPLINTVFQLGFGTLIMSLLHMSKNPLRYLFTNNFLQLSGMMCYSLYLWHGNMQMMFMADRSPMRVLVFLIFLFSLSFLTYRYIEFGNKKLGDVLPK